MTDINNPLRQYFRRPVIHFRLPSGGAGYKPGTLAQTQTGEYPVFAITAVDEITLNTADGLFNGSAVADVIKSCVPGILDPWSLTSVDLDAVLVAIKIASNGAKMEIETQCPSCTKVSKFDINLSAVLATLEPGDFSSELTVGELQFKFKPLTYRDLNSVQGQQFQLQKNFELITSVEDVNERTRMTREALISLTDLTMQMIATMIEYVKSNSIYVDDKNYIYDFLRNCDKNMYEAVKDYVVALKERSELKPLDVKCPECSHEYQQSFTLNASNFFG